LPPDGRQHLRQSDGTLACDALSVAWPRKKLHGNAGLTGISIDNTKADNTERMA
jgi:hypothetical protein